MINYQFFPRSHGLTKEMEQIKAIKDYYTSAAAKSYFIDREGQKIFMPVKFLPSQTFLERHRASLAG